MAKEKAAVELAKRTWRIDAQTLSGAGGRDVPALTGENIFKPGQLHPKQCLPAGVAMDEAMSVPSELLWAAQAYGAPNGAMGETFMGYPLLSEMAQRAEYRRISETLARHMTRKWIKLKAKSENSDKSERIKALNEAMDRLQMRDRFRKQVEHDGFFGRGHIYIDLGTTDDREELKTNIGDGWNKISELKIERGALKALRNVEPVWCYPTEYESNDPLKPNWYKPSSWFVMGKQLHGSRLLTLVGREVPDLLKPAYSFGGLSLTQMAFATVQNWLRTRQSVADMIRSFSVMVLKTNFIESLVNMGESLFNRLKLFNVFRDNRGVFAIDKETEEIENVSAPLGGLGELQMQAQEQQCSVTGIPAIELLGVQPAGFNASSEGEIRTFYSTIHSAQEAHLRPNITRVLGIMMLSEFGEVDPDIVFEFEPLWSQTPKERAEEQKTKAETGAGLVEAGILHAEEERKRLAHDPDSDYQGLVIEDVPEPPGGEGAEAGEPGENGEPKVPGFNKPDNEEERPFSG